MRTIPCCVLLSLVVTNVLDSAITVREAKYAAGVLIVHGRITTPAGTVRLDERYRTDADATGAFTFRIRYLPRNCRATLRAAKTTLVIPIENCEPVGTPAAP